MEFRNLPPEVLDLILGNQDTSWMVLRLWKCGNALLNTKLSSAITYIDLRHLSGLTSSYPRFLSCLQQLRHLSIHTSRELKTTIDPNSTNELTKLPKTLESLCITSENSHTPFLNYAAALPSEEPRSSDDGSHPGSYPLIDISTLFPKLHTLGVQSYCGSLIPARFSALPSTILTLALDKIYLNASECQFFALLPRSLTHLRADVEISFPNDASVRSLILADLANAPPHLELISSLECFGIEPDDLSWLPRSLTSLGQKSRTLQKIRHAPPNLDSIACSGEREDGLLPWTLELPKCLTHLQWFPISSDSSILKLNALMALPRTLTSLSIAHYDMIAWNDLRALVNEVGLQEARNTDWPPLLKTFDLSCSNFSLEQFGLLPSTITDLFLYVLSFTYRQSSKTLDCGLLPTSLIKLRIGFSKADATLELCGTMPTGLHTVALCGFLKLGADDGSIKVLSGSNLTTLDAGFPLPRLAKDPPLSLPPGLTALVLNEWPARWFGALPRSITAFQLHMLFPHDLDQLDDSQDFFGALPPGLTRLTLYTSEEDGFESPKVFSSSSLSSLPSLKVLYISDNLATFPSSIIKNLSRSLQSLSLRLISLDEEDAPFLPPQLRSLDLGPDVDPHEEHAIGNWTVYEIDRLSESERTIVESSPKFQTCLNDAYH